MGSLRDELSGARSAAQPAARTPMPRCCFTCHRRRSGRKSASRALPFTGAIDGRRSRRTWVDDTRQAGSGHRRVRSACDLSGDRRVKIGQALLRSCQRSAVSRNGEAVTATIARDLTEAVGAAVPRPVDRAASTYARLRHELEGESIDGLAVAVDRYDVAPSVPRRGGAVDCETLRHATSSARCARSPASRTTRPCRARLSRPAHRS